MKNYTFIIFSVFAFFGCSDHNETRIKQEDIHLVNDILPFNKDKKTVTVVIEIPAGLNEKWEVNKKTGQLMRDTENGKPRTIHYLGYPANYGFIPQTLLPKEKGGDGDPIDAIVLGKVLEQGAQVSCVVLGGIQLLDRGENDFKVILAPVKSEYARYKNIDTLKKAYPGMIEAIEDWFVHYKGPGKMFSNGIVDRYTSEVAIRSAHQEYLKMK